MPHRPHLTQSRVILLVVSALTVALAVLPRIQAHAVSASPSVAVATERIVGDLTMDDGVRLRYTVVKPVGGKALPTFFEYSGYDPGTNPDANYISQFVSSGEGYNYIGVNLRSAGCPVASLTSFNPKRPPTPGV